MFLKSLLDSFKGARSGNREAGTQGDRGSHSGTDQHSARGSNEAAELDTLFTQARYPEMEAFARSLTVRFPGDGMGWKALGAALLFQGRPEESEAPLQQAIALAPGDADCRKFLGMALHRQHRFADAETNYRRALELAPGFTDVHANLGSVLNELHRPGEAEASFRLALEFTPQDARVHNFLGVALMSQGRVGEAEACYRRALELDPGLAAAHNYLGGALREQDRLAEAEASCRQALALNPDLAGAHNMLGVILADRNLQAEAEACYRRAIEIDPDYAGALSNLGNTLRAQGKSADALVCYERLVEIDPEDDVALHWYNALSGTGAQAAPPKYVAAVFDNYAKTFDTHLVNVLNYRIPEEIVALLVESWPPRDDKRDILDLGCGTGLVGAAIAPYARQLVGVDLSGKMLEIARGRGDYTRLEKADLLETMAREAPGSYDTIVAADVFIYVGNIDAIVAEAKRLLRRGGLFCFSAETLDPSPGTSAKPESTPDVKLLPTARFAHSRAYLQRLAQQNGFETRHFSLTTIRHENGVPNRGWLVLWGV